MRYYHIETQRILTISEVRLEQPAMGIPDGANLAGLGYSFLVEAPAPVVPAGYKLLEVPPSSDGENWQTNWELVALEPEEIAQEVQIAIDNLERDYQLQMLRITRESLIALAEERATALGVTLAQLKAKNKGYAGLVELEAMIDQLRGTLT